MKIKTRGFISLGVKITSISDLHIKSPEDGSFDLLMNFLTHEETLNSNAVFLLGDIFDFMMGEHREYLKIYDLFFVKVKDLLVMGKEVHFFEGNHDFHLYGLFKRYFNSDKFFYHKGGLLKDVASYKVYFDHGDNLQSGDLSYKIVKFILRNPFSRFLFNTVFPFGPQQNVADYLSSKSRKRGTIYYTNQEQLRKKFRGFVTQFCQRVSLDVIICGHSHCLDDFVFLQGKRYVNNGYPPQTRRFISMDEAGPRFCYLSENV